ncbi:MAG: hypothetical protein Q9160_008422 [Pyrenula sp. 1 TL-2023]
MLPYFQSSSESHSKSNFHLMQSLSNVAGHPAPFTTNGRFSSRCSSSAHAIRPNLTNTQKDVIYPRNSLSQPELASTIPDSQTRSPDTQRHVENLHGQATNGQCGKKMSQKSHTSDATEPLSQTTFNKQLAGNRGATGDDNTLQTGVDGHAGDVDLVSSLQLEGLLEEDADLNDGIAESSPQQTQIRHSQFPESQRFDPPSVRGKKRDSRGNEIISPQLPRNPLAGQTNGTTPAQPLGLSQVFQATQAATSPFVNGVPTELHSDRPSPYVNIQARPHTSGPGSSPLIGRDALHRSLYDPFANYTTLDESQAKRKSEELQSEVEEHFVSEDDSDDSPNRVKRRNFEGRIEKERRVFVAAPYSSRNIKVSPLASSPPMRQKDASSPSNPHAKLDTAEDRTIELISDDENEADDAHGMQSDNDCDVESERGANELASTRRPIHKALSEDDDKENVDVDAVQVPDTTKRAYTVANGVSIDVSPSFVRTELHGNQVIPSSSLPNETRTSTNSQHIDVADSQPSPKVQEGSPKVSHPLSSLNAQNTSTVPQSQLPPNGTHVSASPSRLEPALGNTALSSVESRSLALDQQGVQARKIGSLLMKERIDVVRDHNAGHQNENEPQANGPNQAVLSNPGAIKPKCSSQLGLNAPRQTLGSALPPGQEHAGSLPDTSPSERSRSNRDGMVSANASRSIVGISSDHSSNSENIPRHSETSTYETAKTNIPLATIKAPASSLSRISSMCESPNGGKRKRMSAIAGQNSPEKQNDSNGFSVQDFFHEDTELQEALGSSSPIHPGRYRNRRRVTGASETASKTAHLRSPTTNNAQELELARRESLSPGHIRSNPVFEFDDKSPPSRRLQQSAKLSRSRSESSAKSLSRPRMRLIERMTESRVLVSSDTTERQDPSKSQSGKGQPVDSGDFPPSSSLVQQANVEISEQNAVAPNHVFARYRSRYFPAKCLAVLAESSRYRIQWPGYEPDEIDIHGVRRLELRLGDHVKADSQGIPKVTHIVRGFKGTIHEVSCQADSPLTDVFGNERVIIAPKQQRGSKQCRDVPISEVYLDSNMWGQMKDRSYEFKQSLVPPQNLMTPPERPSTPNTPMSRSRRTNSHLGASSFSNRSGIFAGMAFAVSYDDNVKKDFIKNTILQQGGQILESGFQDLFEVSASAPISPNERAKPSHFTNSKLVLRSSAMQLKFVALITDRHSRKVKYLQALALNFPCLSGKWLEECVKKGMIIGWSPYLLPAGESKALDGATKSRILAPYDPCTSSISTILNGRTLLFEGDHVTFIKPKGRKDERKEEMHNDRMFLLKAMGASEISQVNDPALAKTSLAGMTSCDGHQWIVTDGNRDKSFELGALNSSGSHSDGSAESAIVVFDFIVQSLIHGGLLDS